MPEHLGLCGESSWVSYEDDRCDCDLIKEARSEVLADLHHKVTALPGYPSGDAVARAAVLALIERGSE